MLLLLLILVSHSTIICGPTCSKVRVVPVPPTYVFGVPAAREETPTEERLRRTGEICDAVIKMPLINVFLLHCRTSQAEFIKFNLDPIELVIFQAAIKKHYENNIVEIQKLTEKSIEKYRRNIMAPLAKAKVSRRRRRGPIGSGEIKRAREVLALDQIAEDPESKSSAPDAAPVPAS